MTEMTDLDAARSDFMECAVGAAVGKGGRDNELEERQARCELSYPYLVKRMFICLRTNHIALI